MADETPTTPAGTPTAAPVPDVGASSADPGGNGEALRGLTEQVLAEHSGRVGGRFAPGAQPWNKGRRLAVGSGSAPLAGPAVDDGVSLGTAPGMAPVDAETVRRLLECGLTALDETLKSNFVLGWERVTGDHAFAEAQAESYALKPAQKEAIGIAAALCAEKYAMDLQFLPETALAVAVAGYALPWFVGYSGLRKAAKLKAKGS